ncbi:MAG: AMP-binding protein [Saprospiraceae bacterium]|nr:AMP-binding protein [Saprospiraceae bacterium]MDG2418791.1 AMP-binding protein [Saprospiraceae bacterium]
MYQDFQNIILDGKKFGVRELQKMTSILSWKNDVYQFIREWLDGKSAIQVSTSGTTGTPKTIFLQKNKMIASALKTGEYFNIQKNERALLCLSPNYIAGKMMIVRAFVLGLDLVLVEPSGNPLKNTVFEEVNFAAMVPLQALNSFQNEKEHQQFQKINKIIIGGGSVGKTLLNFIQKENNNFYATYGMTETITHIAVKTLRNGMLQQSSKKEQSNFFETLTNVQIKTDDRGCLIINAPDVAEETVVTNDLVEIITPSKFKWLGRFDNIINTGGIKIIPENVEALLEKYLDRRFFISSQSDELLGERIILIIEGKAFSQKESEGLSNFMRNNLTKFSIPKAVFFIQKFLETDSGKIKRIATKELL